MSNNYRLIFTSLLMSFVEMLLIRWTSSNIFSLFFFTNFILIASFLGIGIGFLRANHNKQYFHWSPIFLSLVILFCYLYSFEYQAKVNGLTGNLIYLNKIFKNHLFPVFMTLPLVFIAVTLTMAAIADNVALLFKQFNPLSAYRLEVLGTIAGIAGFAGLAFLGAPPIVWGMIVVVLYIALLWSNWSRGFSVMMCAQVAALGLILGVFYQEAKTDHIWSTYYKIQVKEYLPHSYVVNVNGLAQQVIEPVAQRLKLKPFYAKPYEHMRHKNQLDNVLVIGSGTGGDVAIALAKGAKHVDAVEIDKKLYQLGRKLNVNHPYQDPRVTVYIDDGRAFLQKTTKKYDLIIYALTDSLMLIPGQSSMRLENYLYTLEGLSAAALHLQPEGVFTIYNYYGLRWFADRLANTLSVIYQKAPCFDTYTSKDDWATVLTISPNAFSLSCPQVWQSQHRLSEIPATDSHPFIYLEENTLTPMYLIGVGFIALLACFLLRKNGVTFKTIHSQFDLFLMGAAFLLLETKSVISYALLFGTTWMVNSLVFIGILVSVYAAIEVTRHLRAMSLTLLYGLLILALLITWILPLGVLLAFDPSIRFILATLLTFTPIFLANLIFAHRFQDTNTATAALGANLIGAVLGGLLEYGSLVLGYQHFALIILAIYSMAFIFSLRQMETHIIAQK